VNVELSNTEENSMITVVMTGATSGIGEYTAQIIARQPETHLLIGARGSGRAGPAGVDILPLDLMSLASVQRFADEVKQRLGSRKLDTLVLNAGLQRPAADRRTAEGFEITFGVNHLAHYLLARLLLPVIADEGRLVFTTSDTHDPSVVPMIAPKTLDAQTLAHPTGRAGGVRAYSASKLCNLLTARSFATLDYVKNHKITVIAYNPGFTPGTGLGGSMSAPAQIAARAIVFPLLRLASRFSPAFYPGTAEQAGEVLAAVALGTVTPPPNRVYVSLVRGEVTFPDPSMLALDDGARDRLWQQSAAMVNLPI
jgi:NAD(P)-dependent dehydrogenase (short-subunit alcohol dehydrogenase family)